MTLKLRILRSLTRLFIILVSLTMSLFSEKMLISNRCISGFMPNLIKKSWTVSSRDRTKTKCPKRGGVPLDFQTLQHPCSHKNFKIETCLSTWLTACRYFLDNKLDVGYTYSVIANALTREVLP